MRSIVGIARLLWATTARRSLSRGSINITAKHRYIRTVFAVERGGAGLLKGFHERSKRLERRAVGRQHHLHENHRAMSVPISSGCRGWSEPTAKETAQSLVVR